MIARQADLPTNTVNLNVHTIIARAHLIQTLTARINVPTRATAMLIVIKLVPINNPFKSW